MFELDKNIETFVQSNTKCMSEVLRVKHIYVKIVTGILSTTSVTLLEDIYMGSFCLFMAAMMGATGKSIDIVKDILFPKKESCEGVNLTNNFSFISVMRLVPFVIALPCLTVDQFSKNSLELKTLLTAVLVYGNTSFLLYLFCKIYDGSDRGKTVISGIKDAIHSMKMKLEFA